MAAHPARRSLRPAPWSPVTRVAALVGTALLTLAAAGPTLPRAIFDAPPPTPQAVADVLADTTVTAPVPSVLAAGPVTLAPRMVPAAPVPTAHRSHARATRRTHRPAARGRHAGRWVPTGVGIWIYDWAQTARGDAHAVVARARAVGLTTLYLRTGSTWDGFTGTRSLSALLAAAHGTNVNVVVWDFPKLANPRADALRLARAAVWGRGNPRWAHVRAVAPDIETPMEGTDMSPKLVSEYLHWLRWYLPPSISILTTVPWPSVYRVGYYPYPLVARLSDALLPMAYWYDNNPTIVTAQSIDYLKLFGKPVIPIGQGYDSRVDAPSLPASHPVPELHQFIATARRLGAPGLSLWSWQTAGAPQWRALSWAHHAFPARAD